MYGRGSLLSLLANPRFSDVNVIVGEERMQYDLHRAIICLQSTFFEAACKEGFIEGNTREINLPDIEPDAFETIATWLYSGGFSFKGKLSKEKFCDLYAATDYLGIDSLKRAMMSTLAKSLQNDMLKRPNDGAPVEKTVETPLNPTYSLTQTAPCSDWQVLRQVVDKVIPQNRLSGAWLRGLAETDPVEINGFFQAPLLDSYQEFVGSMFYGSYTKHLRNNTGKCHACRKSVNYHKREGPPQRSEKSP
ncbi:hypothetical protein EYR41_004838 [Orbilia oligospora]|uniref:Uncharacterized protein n=1 Tax=Orbilia oligospora TaxID=2813651 RepID=A0A7C8K5W4_ORBOL|nr:hypothetical protein TWF751_010837 [Orbilia oligospora]KAF3292551.1 hypothetical protein TWF132_005601 [Orbilia oligospora]TGJ68752.1 hypothetical protein EYR41_004838 [Orbilia oligospora]